MELKFKILVFVCLGFVTNSFSQNDSSFAMSLQQCIEFAEINNTQQKVALSNVEIAKLDVKETKAIGLPQINAGANFTHNLKIATQVLPDFISPSVYGVLYQEGVLNPQTNPLPVLGSNPVQFGVPYSFTANASLRQLIFDGVYFLGLKAANEYVELSRLQLAKNSQSLAENITKSYLLVLTTHENKKLIIENQGIVKQTLKEVTALYDNGFAEKLDVDRVELSNSSLAIRLKSVDQQLEILAQSLKLNMGMNVNTKLVLTDSLQGLMLSNLTANSTLNVRELPDYKIFAQNQKLQELNKDRYKVGRYPNVMFNALYGQQSFANKGSFGDLTTDFFPVSNYQVSVGVPIWDGNARRAQIAKVEQSLVKNELMMQNFENAATLQYNASLSKYNTSLELMDLQKKNLKIAQDIYKKAGIKFKEGLGSSLELAQAENDYKSAQVGYLNSVYDLLIANVELKKSTGQLK